MEQREQVQFVHDLVGNIEAKLLKAIVDGKIPPEWDGIEFRWLLAAWFNADWVMPEAKKRKREFKNYVLVNNL
jgi:hypothetical protein